MSTTTGASGAAPHIALKIALWAAQILVGLPFIGIGLMKLLTPIPKLAAMLPWTGQLPEAFVRFIGVVDITGGVGMLLPALTRIKPGLTVWAALGCTVLQVFAIIFHTSRGEAAFTPGNYVFLALSIFVLWGRGRKAPISPRT
jgi:uncharacterized membrane protein YphA (DoxX/SURF4 family)